MASSDKNRGIPDPFAAFRQFLDEGEREMNRIIADQSATDEAKASRARSANAALDMQNVFLNLWGRYFESINLPSRSDVLRVGDRLGRIEEGIARLEDRLRALELSGSPADDGAGRQEPARPKRTRRPPKSKDRPKDAKK